MELKEMIYRRKSFRKYRPDPVDGDTIKKIKNFFPQMKPLYPSVRVRAEIVDRENVKCLCPWTTSQVIAVFSEEADGFLENAGFMFQQLDLYLQALGLGTCWLGMGRLDSHARSQKEDALQFVIMLAFGYPKDTYRSSVSQFRRKQLSQISDTEDPQLEPARLAPSSVNSQPWYFTHEDGAIHVYCVKKGMLKTRGFSDMNRIDIGIALAHMYITNPDTFRFFVTDQPEEIRNYGYIGSFTLSPEGSKA